MSASTPAREAVASLVVARHRHPRADDAPLTPAQREAVAAYAAGFEECMYGLDALRQLGDGPLIAAASFAMADYARAQL